MVSIESLHRPGPWTVDDLGDFHDHRVELVDGALLVTPAPTPRHDAVNTQLVVILADQIGSDRVRLPAGITFSPGNYRLPDAVVLREGFDAWNAPITRPEDVVLVVEVVSPTSLRNDKVAKLNQYAAEGIRAYWIVETDPELKLTAHALPEGAATYLEVGHWSDGETVQITEPFPVTFDVSDLRG